MKVVSLNIHDAIVKDCAVSDFYFPLNINLQDEFSIDLAENLIEIVNSGDVDNDIVIEALWLSVAYIVIEVSNAIVNRRLRQNARRDCVEIQRIFSGEDTLLKYENSNDEYSYRSVFVSEIKKFPKILGYARWLLSDLIVRDQYCRVVPEFISKESDVLCFGGSREMCDYARSIGKRIVLSRYDQWFGGVERAVPQGLMRNFERLLDDVVVTISRTATFAGLGNVSERDPMLTKIVGDIVCAVIAHLAHVGNFGRFLPSELWLGSGGNIYNRTIARVAQKCGSKVISFDHGSGSGWVNLPLVRLIDVDFCDEYHTFTDAQAKGISALRRKELSVDKGPNPEILPSKFPLFSEPQIKSRVRPVSGKLTAMYVPSMYENDRAFIPPMLPEVVAFDFQVSLLSCLQKEGFDVKIKPHPECVVGIPSSLIEVSKASVLASKFEDVCCEADLLVFDYLTTSAIRAAFFTDLPIVLIDHGRVPIADEALPLLTRRVEILRVLRDGNGRCDPLSAQRINACIQTAKEKVKDKSFLEEYFLFDSGVNKAL